MSAHAYLVRRGFFLAGRPVKPGELLEIPDDNLAAELLTLRRIVAANDATRARVRECPTVTWEPPRDPPPSLNPWEPALPGRLALAGRRN